MADFTVKNALRRFLNSNEPRMVYFFVTMWGNQQRALTYKEIREAILAGEIDPAYMEEWRQDYTHFVNTYMQPMWMLAIDDAAKQLDRWLYENRLTPVLDWFDPMSDGVKNWVVNRAADFVTNSTQGQLDALNAVISQAATIENMSVDQLSRAIRPMVGLTKPQAAANMRYYANLLENGTAQKRALDLSIRYGARQHRYRGYNIARTELAFGYNKGADEAVRQAQHIGYMGDCLKEWSAVLDHRTCDKCRALDGQQIAMDEEWDFQTKLAANNPGIRLTPPAHPSCRCAIKYVEISEPKHEQIQGG